MLVARSAPWRAPEELHRTCQQWTLLHAGSLWISTQQRMRHPSCVNMHEREKIQSHLSVRQSGVKVMPLLICSNTISSQSPSQASHADAPANLYSVALANTKGESPSRLEIVEREFQAVLPDTMLIRVDGTGQVVLKALPPDLASPRQSLTAPVDYHPEQASTIDKHATGKKTRSYRL